MSYSTEKLIPGLLPPKEETEGVDFLAILDSFDPSVLSEEQLNALAHRNPYHTGKSVENEFYLLGGQQYPVPSEPVEGRLRSAKYSMNYDRGELEKKTTYKAKRTALIKAIGSKAAYYIVNREYNSYTLEDLCRLADEYKMYMNWLDEQRKAAEDEYERAVQLTLKTGDTSYLGYYDWKPASISEKVVMVRKGIKNADGKPFTQREVSKLIDYPINKYVAAERNDDAVTYELLEKLIMICHANPYYLFDQEIEACEGVYKSELEDDILIICDLHLIYRWIKNGKSTDVSL